MSHTDKEVLALVREAMARGVPLRRALAMVIENEGLTVIGRKRYLYRVIPKRVERAERRAAKHKAENARPQYEETPLPDDSTPLCYKVEDDGKYVIVSVDRYVFEYGLTFGRALFASFQSTIPSERHTDVGSEIRAESRRLAQDYFDRLPMHRKTILRRPF